MFETVTIKGQDYAMIVRAGFNEDGITFFTPNSYSQQLGYMKHPRGHVIAAHMHNPIPREVQLTKEVLFIKSGRVRVDFYDETRNYLQSRMLGQGDIILLINGGHGLEILEPSEMVEVKQGPFMGEKDKTCFEAKTPRIFNFGDET